MKNHNTRVSEKLGQNSVAHYLAKVYSYMALGLGLTGASAFFCSSIPALREIIFSTGVQLLFAIIPLGIVIYLSRSIMRLSAAQAQMWFWGYSLAMGISFSTIFYVFSLSSIAQCFLATSSGFLGLSLYGYTTKKDLSSWGSFLMMGLIGMIIASIVGIFLKSTALSMAISAVGVLIFSGLTAYDVQMIKNMYYQMGGNVEMREKMAVFGALRLYMDFINLFISLLNFLGDRR